MLFNSAGMKGHLNCNSLSKLGKFNKKNVKKYLKIVKKHKKTFGSWKVNEAACLVAFSQ